MQNYFKKLKKTKSIEEKILEARDLGIVFVNVSKITYDEDIKKYNINKDNCFFFEESISDYNFQIKLDNFVKQINDKTYLRILTKHKLI